MKKNDLCKEKLIIPKCGNVWMDTDGDMDDLMSMSLLSLFPKVNVLGVSPHGVGAAYLGGNLKWAVGMKKQLNMDYVVVAGKTTPVSFSNRYPFSATLAANENFGLMYEEADKKDYLSNDCLINELKKINGQFDLMIYGGGTNWVEVISKYPQIFDKVNRVYLYAGIINKDQNKEIGIVGNIKETFSPSQCPYDNDFAEWNVFVDTVSIKVILDFFKSKVILFPINLASGLPFDENFCSHIDRLKDSPVNCIWKTIVNYLVEKDQILYIKLWSQVPTLFYLFLQSGKIFDSAVIETHDVSVITDYEVQNDKNGKIILDSGNGNKTSVVMSVDAKEVFDELFEILSKQ